MDTYKNHSAIKWPIFYFGGMIVVGIYSGLPTTHQNNIIVVVGIGFTGSQGFFFVNSVSI